MTPVKMSKNEREESITACPAPRISLTWIVRRKEGLMVTTARSSKQISAIILNPADSHHRKEGTVS